MIDDDMKVYLIEVNTNPCLDTSPCPLLHRLITQILDQTFKVAVDPFLRGRDSSYGQALEMAVSEINWEMVYSNAEDLQQGADKLPGHNNNDIRYKSSKLNSQPLRRENSADVIMDPDEP